MTLWSDYGLESAAEELAMYIQFANPGDSLLDWNPLENSEKTLDRGNFNISKDDIIAFFLKNRNVTSAHRKRAMRLMMDSIPDNTNSQDIDVAKLLEIWEMDGLDAAVLAWKEMSKKKLKSRPNDNAAEGRKTSSKNRFLEEMGISPEDWAALKKEIEEGEGTHVDLVDMEELSFEDD